MRPHASCMGFVRRRSYISNAALHVQKEQVYTLDIKDFFPSIASGKVRSLLLRYGYGYECADALTELCTLNGVLPQGAPTSPALSNIACFFLDARLSKLAHKCNLAYSRYADDMTFSGRYIKSTLRSTIKNIIQENGFVIAKHKERLTKQKKKQRQVVTGLVVNRHLSIGRKKYNMLRAMLHDCVQKGVEIVQEETRDKNGDRYYIKKDMSNFKTDFFEYILGAVNIFEQMQDYIKMIKVLKYLKDMDWERYYNYRSRKINLPFEKSIPDSRHQFIEKKIDRIAQKYYKQKNVKIQIIGGKLIQKDNDWKNLENSIIITNNQLESNRETIKDSNKDKNEIKALKKENKKLTQKIKSAKQKSDKLRGEIKVYKMQVEETTKDIKSMLENSEVIKNSNDKLIKLTKKMHKDLGNEIQAIKSDLSSALVDFKKQKDRFAEDAIYSKINDRIIENINSKIGKDYIEFEDTIKNWLTEKYYSRLENKSKRDFAIAEYLASKPEDGDPSLPILQVCRSIEREVLAKVFISFRSKIMISQCAEEIHAERKIFESAEGMHGSISKSYQCLYQFCFEKKDLSLGSFGHIIKNSEKNNKYRLYECLNNHILETYGKIEEKVRNYIKMISFDSKKLSITLSELRNYCAHPKDIDEYEKNYDKHVNYVQYERLRSFSMFSPDEFIRTIVSYQKEK